MCGSSMCTPVFYRYKSAPIVKGMITKHLEGKLFCPAKTVSERKANMFDIYTCLQTLQCQGIIGNWTVIPNECGKITIRFQTSFVTWDEMVVYCDA